MTQLAESADPPGPETAGRHRVERATLMVYAAITLLGVIAAASWKHLAEDAPELLGVLVGSSLAVVLAHVWSSLMANRLVHRRFPDKAFVFHELQVAASFFIATGVAAAAVALSGLIVGDFDTVVLIAELSLVVLLFVVGVGGALGAGVGWARALVWGVADAAVGLVIVLIKLGLGG